MLELGLAELLDGTWLEDELLSAELLEELLCAGELCELLDEDGFIDELNPTTTVFPPVSTITSLTHFFKTSNMAG